VGEVSVVGLAPRLAPKREEFHTHHVPVSLPPELRAAADRVIGRLSQFPWLWEALDAELQDFHAKKAHGEIAVDFDKDDEVVTLKLSESYGDVKDVDVTVVRKVRKP
jgi:hypothetical protein